MPCDSKSADNLLIFRLASGAYCTGLNRAQVRQLSKDYEYRVQISERR
jgi:hypothetical protein